MRNMKTATGITVRPDLLARDRFQLRPLSSDRCFYHPKSETRANSHTRVHSPFREVLICLDAPSPTPKIRHPKLRSRVAQDTRARMAWPCYWILMLRVVSTSLLPSPILCSSCVSRGGNEWSLATRFIDAHFNLRSPLQRLVPGDARFQRERGVCGISLGSWL